MEPVTSPEDQRRAKAMREAGLAGDGGHSLAHSALMSLPRVQLDEGKMKYVLVEVEVPNSDQKVHLVRGIVGRAYHADVAEDTLRQLRSLGLRYQVLGGGRIQHSAAQRSIEIYGYSVGFPWAGGAFRHDITKRECERVFAGYSITTSNDGY